MREQSQKEEADDCGNPEGGFTLIELVLTIIVIAILGAVVSLGLSSLSSVRLDNAVKKVVGDLRYAQQLAMTTRIRHGLEVESLTQYTVHQDLPPDTAIKDPVDLGSNFVVNFDTYQQGQISGVQFAAATPFCGGGVIEFNAIGEPTDTNGTLLGCAASVVMNYSGNSRTITIEPNTGNLTY